MYHPICSNVVVRKILKHCQNALHVWGGVHQVEFEKTKKSVHILCWYLRRAKKMRRLVRVKGYYSIPDLIRLYKAHVFPYAERTTPAIFHFHPNSLVWLD